MLLPLLAAAQPFYGYLSYKQLLRQMPEYAQVQAQLTDLKGKYTAEAQRGETEFQKKFVEFLQGQKDFPKSIMQKRQTELQSLMDNGVEFRKQMKTLLEQAEQDMMAGVYDKLNEAIQQVGAERGFAFILNTDENGLPFANPAAGEDVTQLVLQKLQGEPVTPQQAPDIPQQAEPQQIEPTEEAEIE